MDYQTGKVLEILDEGTVHDEYTQQDSAYQQVKTELSDGSVVVVEYGGIYALQPEQLVQVGDTVVLVNSNTDSNQYSIIDHYRLPWLGLVVAIFMVAVVACTRWRGIGALVSVGLSLLVLVKWLVPQLLITPYPLTVTFGTLVVLAVITFYLGHGTRANTQIALICTIVSLGLALAAAAGAAWVLDLSGAGSEAALSLKYGFGEAVNLKSILLAGLLLGALGVLDDVTTAQVQSVQELKDSNPALTWQELFSRAFRIGRAHIVSLVNTLMLAYAGAALPAFLVLSNYSIQPLWVALNSETIMEEVIQMLIGSFTLVLAVPLTTIVAAWWISGDARRQK